MIDARALTLDDAAWARVAIALADRNGSVGGDGLLAMTAGNALNLFGFRMWNPDGSEAETCLNGLRCVARAGFEAFGIDAATVRLRGSVASVARDPELAPGVTTIRETAGPVTRDVTAWPMAIGRAENIETPIAQLGPRAFTALAIPNPHLVAFVDRVDEAELVAIGKICEAAPDWLPNRANVSFVEIRDSTILFVRTFERGVGLTDSCGSAMAASAHAACLTGRMAFDRELTVRNRGGIVRAEASADGMVRLSGNATFEWSGDVEVDLATARAGPVTLTARYDAEIAAWERLVSGLA